MIQIIVNPLLHLFFIGNINRRQVQRNAGGAYKPCVIARFGEICPKVSQVRPVPFPLCYGFSACQLFVV